MQSLFTTPFILALTCFTTCFSQTIQAQALPTSFVQSIKKSQIPLDSVGVYVQELDSPTKAAAPLISWQADQPFQPASTMKVVTSYAALDMLGPTYTWKTTVYKTGKLDGGVLQGNLILQGGGDPHLVVENFWLLMRQIREQGIRKIQGDLILDSSWMEPQKFNAADFDGDPTRPYNVGPSALLVNFNVLSLKLHGDPDGLQVTTLTPLAFDSSINVNYVTGACGDWRYKLTPAFSMGEQRMKLALTGTYPVSCGDQTWSLQPYPLTNADYVGAMFRQMWQESGGELIGAVKSDVVAPTAELVTEMSSPAMAQILYDMNKYSNNVMTRLVLLTLDKQINQQPANPERAAKLVEQWFPRIGIPAQGLQIENGSGLSRTERISPFQMGRMLNHAFASPYMSELMASLPILGKDGTTKTRALKYEVAGHAHIKTGSLEGVRGIAGYVLAASGKRYAVACFVNHKNAVQGIVALDELLQWVYANG